VLHFAAIVGGLYANMNDKVRFFQDNMKINMNIIETSYKYKVEKLVCCLSTCVVPDCMEFSEKDLHNGPPHPSNEGYAYAKRMCEV